MTHDPRVQFVADAITSPTAAPRTKARFLRYAREAVAAVDTYDAAPVTSVLEDACRRIQAREPFTSEEIDALAEVPSVRAIVVSYQRPDGRRVLKGIEFHYSHNDHDRRAQVVHQQ